MFPSVTTILSPWTDFSSIRPDVLAAASERGQIVHRACGAIASGLWAPPVTEEIAGYVRSFATWFRDAVEEVIAVEPSLSHPVYGYVGHPDLIVRIRGDEGNTLVDFKTPLAQAKSWRIQLAAYWDLCRANTLDVSRVIALRLRRSGSFPIVNEYTGTVAGDFSTFLACRMAWQYFKGA